MSSPNQLVTYTAAAINKMKASVATIVQTLDMLTDADQAAATPVTTINGETYIVNNWAAGNYVGDVVTAYVDGDICQWNDTLGGFVLVLALASIVNGTRVIIADAASAGSFVGRPNDIAEYDGTAWQITDPLDGQLIRVIGEQTVHENTSWVWDASTATWIQVSEPNYTFSNTLYVDKAGNDDTGDGSVQSPYLTIGAAIAASAAADSVLVGPGVFAETLAIVQSNNIEEIIKGTVSITDTVIGGAVLTLTPAAAGIVMNVSCSVVNLSNATAADIGIHVDVVAGVGLATLTYTGNTLSGGAAGQAIRVTGDNAAQTVVTTVVIDNVTHVIGAIASITEAATDLVRFNNCLFEGGNTAWIDISGPAGDFIIANCLQAAAAAAETIDYGLGTAVGASLHIGSSILAGELEMNSNAGTGTVQLGAEAHIGRITALLAAQLYRILLGGDKMELVVLNVDLDTIADTDMFTVPAGYVFQPYAVRTVNRGVDSQAALVYAYDGSGAGSIVGGVGAAALADGCTNETVIVENVAAASVVQFSVTTGAGAAGDVADGHVEGYLKAI